MYEWPSHSFRPSPHVLPPAGLGTKSSQRLQDTGHLTARSCLAVAVEPAPLLATTYQQQAQQVLAGGAAAEPQALAGARPRGGDSGGAGACLKPGPVGPQLQALQEAREAAYQRNKLEPLGRSRPLDTSLPEGLGTIKAFGVALNARELERTNQGKQTIYPGDSGKEGGQEEVEVHAQYVRTHRDFAPGEQRKWGVDFKGADPSSLCFGKTPAQGTEGELQKALQPGVANEWAPLPERLARFALRHRAALGVARSLNALERDLPPDFAYGKPSTRGEWGADRVLRGGYCPAEQQPDWDLGRPGSKSGFAAAARERALLREDSAQQAQGKEAGGVKEVAGNEEARGAAGALWSCVTTNAAASPTLAAAAAGAGAGAGALGRGRGGVTMVELLRPIESVYRGVTEDHFRQPRSRQEMWEVVTASGVVRDPTSFEKIFDRACRGPGNFGCCSLEDFIQARMELQKDQLLHREAQPTAALPRLSK